MRVELALPDPAWTTVYADLRDRVVGVLHDVVRSIDHVGSTSVPGLAAKPVIDIVVTVADPADEGAYLPAVESLGFALRHREPDWYEHRVFGLDDPACNLHVFGVGCVEVDRMIRFRDHLRRNAADRRRYEGVKRELVRRDWPSVQDYADAKTDVVEEILDRAD